MALALTLACAWPSAAPVHAGTAIQRCRASDGATLYTDKPCRAMGAEALPLPAGLATRILREQSREEALGLSSTDAGIGAMDASMQAYADASTPMRLAPAIGRRSVAAGCARTPTQLERDLRGAFALGDVNRIAESYHWVGVSHRGAMRILQRLEAMARQPVADAHYFDARIGRAGAMYASADDSTIGGSGGMLQVTFDGSGGGRIADFDVERYKGCFFVRF